MDVIMYNIEVNLLNTIRAYILLEHLRVSKGRQPEEYDKYYWGKITEDPYVLQLWRIYKSGNYNLFCYKNQRESLPLIRTQQEYKIRGQLTPPKKIFFFEEQRRSSDRSFNKSQITWPSMSTAGVFARIDVELGLIDSNALAFI
jgi:hypothetical protein